MRGTDGSTANRRQPLLPEKSEKHKSIGEVAGGTTAECAAVCCCCPWTLVNLLILTVYKVPKGLCKKVIRKKKKKKLLKHRNALLMEQQEEKKKFGHDEKESDGEDREVDERGEKEAVDLDDEMWDRFYSGGFWKSPRRRDE
ncbi:hypothetical protein LguiB_031901 [Lonicera macranthoides]